MLSEGTEIKLAKLAVAVVIAVVLYAAASLIQIGG